MGGKVREGRVRCGMAAAGARAAGRRAGAQSRNLRPARQAADRVGQRPADDWSRSAAVDVVARSAITRHVAGAVARPLARVCSAPQRHAARIARASANRPHPDRGGTPCRCSWPCSSTATSRPRSRSRRLQARARANVRSKRIRRVQRAQPLAHVTFHLAVTRAAQRTLDCIVYMKVSFRKLGQHQSGTGGTAGKKGGEGWCVWRWGAHANGCWNGPNAHATEIAL